MEDSRANPKTPGGVHVTGPPSRVPLWLAPVVFVAVRVSRSVTIRRKLTRDLLSSTFVRCRGTLTRSCPQWLSKIHVLFPYPILQSMATFCCKYLIPRLDSLRWRICYMEFANRDPLGTAIAPITRLDVSYNVWRDSNSSKKIEGTLTWVFFA